MIDNVVVCHNLFVLIIFNRTYELGVCLCVCVYWPPARLLYHNHEAVVFQPQIGTTLVLGSASNFSVANYLSRPVQPAPRATRFPSEGASDSCYLSPLVAARQASAQDNSPTWVPPVSIPA